MDLRQLRYFVAVAESGSISMAAGRLHVAQSAVSRQMRRLEDEIGGDLFKRSVSGVTLTDSGQMLLERARFILREVESAAGDVSSFSREVHGTVRMAAPASVGRAVYAPTALQFCRRYPRVKLELREIPTDEVLQRLSAGLLDLGIVSDSGVYDHLTVTPLMREHTVLFCPQGSLLANCGRVVAADLERLPIIISAGLRRIFVRRFGELHHVIQIDGVGTALQLALAGIGYAVMPRSTACTADSVNGLVSIPIDGFSIDRSLAVATSRPASLATRVFRSVIEEQVERCIEAGLFTAITPSR